MTPPRWLRGRLGRSAVGIDPVMIALLTFTCTILIRVAIATAGGQ